MTKEIKMYKDWLWVVQEQHKKAEKELDLVTKKIQKGQMSEEVVTRKAELTLMIDSYLKLIDDVTTIINRLQHVEENKK